MAAVFTSNICTNNERMFEAAPIQFKFTVGNKTKSEVAYIRLGRRVSDDSNVLYCQKLRRLEGGVSSHVAAIHQPLATKAGVFVFFIKHFLSPKNVAVRVRIHHFTRRKNP